MLAENGREALLKVGQETPDLIIHGLRMTCIDGWHVATELRATHPPLLPFIAIEQAEELDRELGVEGILAKPFEIDDLIRVVAAFLPAVNAATPARSASPLGRARSLGKAG